MFNIITAKKALFQETSTWAARVVAAGGGFQADSVVIANGFVRQLRSKSYGFKVVYLLPMLGTGIGAARTPLIDAINVGSATSTAFVDADFGQSTGLQGNGTSKILSSLIKPNQLGITNNGGIGYWENNIDFGGTASEVMGCYDNGTADRYDLDLRTNLRMYQWGALANFARDTNAATNGSYYGQRSSATLRKIYFGGVTFANNITNDGATGASDRAIRIVGCDEGGTITFWKGRCALAYMTDGTLSDAEVADLNILLTTALMGPTGKPQS